MIDTPEPSAAIDRPSMDVDIVCVGFSDWGKDLLTNEQHLLTRLAARKMVLLDEVMGGLNTGEKEEIIQLILDLRRRGFTQVVIEHDMRAIMRVSDRVVVLNSGEKLTEGSPTEVANNPEVIAAYLGEKVEI